MGAVRHGRGAGAAIMVAEAGARGVVAGAEAEAEGPGPLPGTRPGRGLAWPAGLAAAGAALFAVFLAQARMVPASSDGASFALQAQEMLHGNVLLHGWTLADVSFYTTELPEYLLLELVRGLGTGVVHAAAAFTYTLLVIGAALLAKGRAQGREGLVRALIAAGILLGPPAANPGTLLSNPDHLGTQVPLLAVWLILDRARPRWWVPAAVALILAVTQVADALVTYEGVLPLAAVCALRLYRQRGRLARNLRPAAYELSLLAAALASYGAASAAARLLRQAGGYVLWPAPQLFTSVTALASRTWLTAESVLRDYGADFSGRRLDAQAAVSLILLAGVALAAWGAARALRRFADAGLAVQVLAASLVALLTAYTVNGNPTIVNGPHEIVGVLPLGAVLAGRLLAGPLIRGRHLAAAGALAACSVAITAHALAQPPHADRDGELAAWLKGHHLRYGVASYWDASSVTVASGGAVRVRPVRWRGGAGIAPMRWETKASWYDGTREDARFLILPSAKHSSCAGAAAGDWPSTAIRVFGPPARTYRAAGAVVLVWDKNLLPELGKPAGSGC
jgi:hypothetical protein